MTTESAINDLVKQLNWEKNVTMATKSTSRIEMYTDLNLWQDDFLDFMGVILMGADKYEPNGWLKPDGSKTSLTDMHASMFRHLAASSAGQRIDKESQLDHLLHLATRALMLYTRIKHDIIHPYDDPENFD